jgi:hypothetical protein
MEENGDKYLFEQKKLESNGKENKSFSVVFFNEMSNLTYPFS